MKHHTVWSVEWVDSEAQDGEWGPYEDCLGDLPIIRSVGYLLAQTSEAITLARSYDPVNESYEGILRIPMSAARTLTLHERPDGCSEGS